MNRLSRITALVLSVMMVFISIPVVAEQQSSVITESTAVYFFRSNDVGHIDTVYFSQEKDIPYISLSNAAMLMRSLADMRGDTNYVLKSGTITYGELEQAQMLSLTDDVDRSASVYILLRENGSFVLFDAADNTIWMSDRDKFMVNSYAVSGGDLVSADGVYLVNGEVDETKVNLYKRANVGQFVREGDVTVIYLDDYAIQIKTVNGELYLPVATLSDLIFQYPVTFNGEALFITLGDLDSTTENENGETQYQLYYKPGARTRSSELIAFNYYELCLLLDQCYGLKTEHEITTSFDEYFTATGLVNKLWSSDITEYTEALQQLMRGYFGDLHSGLTEYSPYTGDQISIDTSSNLSVSVSEYRARMRRFQAAREAAGLTSDGQIINGYSEIGDTAFITFDSFVSASQDYYDKDLQANFRNIYMTDTISLVVWSQAMIHRENSPVKKVVIDLSANGGGNLNACVYVAAWVLGSAAISLENVSTGAQYTTNYWVDTNLDGHCSDSDDLGIDSLDVYCLISGNSFSCANFLAAIFKQDGRVTLVGQTSGGGSCTVLNTAAADGTLFTLSNYFRMSIVKNGSFYSIDQGVEPDIPLRKVSSYYDREALMEYLGNYR